MATLLIRQTHSPYDSSDASEGLDFALGATNFGHNVIVLFSGRGVLQLLNNQAPPAGTKNHAKRLNLLPLYDIEKCYVCSRSLTDFFPAALSDPTLLMNVVKPIETKEIASLLSQVDHVVTF
ncbi:sulfurtransferase complex subunit TusC [Alteromonas pelagimontana]|uniref:Sulfurtransferase complex subunit TusC n=1 Tax=Alteromonas pelagimontana TaxID=1858656 RepID=A0A6M4M854_9ALTE|nr:sulfurtransferase complex subunit TusC [Alteromonas pelagimontana]QJR79337.1 sulfurtransferase complex subunit TusC [Alteromonas pelagimontana]